MNRTKVKKFIKIRWDISWRIKFLRKSEDEQIRELEEAGEYYQFQGIYKALKENLNLST